MLKLGAECLQSVIDSLGLCLCKVSVCLNLPLDVLELGFKLLFALDTLHKHDIVITVHFYKLVVHVFERLVIVLLVFVGHHVLLSQLSFRLRDLLAVLFETDVSCLHL